MTYFLWAKAKVHVAVSNLLTESSVILSCGWVGIDGQWHEEVRYPDSMINQAKDWLSRTKAAIAAESQNATNPDIWEFVVVNGWKPIWKFWLWKLWRF